MFENFANEKNRLINVIANINCVRYTTIFIQLKNNNYNNISLLNENNRLFYCYGSYSC